MKKHFSFVQNRIYFYLISIILFLTALASIFFFKFNLGIDFVGGSVTSVRFEKEINKNDLDQSIKEAGFSYFSIQPSGGDYFVRTQVLDVAGRKKLQLALNKIGPNKELSFQTVGPSVSKDLRQKTVWGAILAIVGIIFYIAYAFRTVPRGYSGFIFGLAAVIALLHDATITAGVFSFLGHFYKNVVVDAYFITALLTTGGYSVHDTIVVADRLRENLIRRNDDIATAADLSLWQVLVRSISTSMTTLFVCLTLFLLGGESIRNFALALMVGVAVGTYSSIFVALPLIVDWYKRKRT